MVGKLAVLVAASLLSVSPPAACQEASTQTASPSFLWGLRPTGSVSLNYRNIGPMAQDFESQIQEEMYLADMYFGLEGPVAPDIPFTLEFAVPTAGRGSVILNQLNFGFDRLRPLELKLGKFIVPFGLNNELYRPDQLLTVTRPLLYADPDSLDLVIRVNSPRPLVSAGYADIGAQVALAPAEPSFWEPEELSLYVVNGLGEQGNRIRTFPTIDFLGVPPVPGNGVNVDFGHQDNNLADNNNPKSFGGRLLYHWGGAPGSKEGLRTAISAMGGQYSLSGDQNYQMYSADFGFARGGWSLTGAFEYGSNELKAPLESTIPGSTAANPSQKPTDTEINRGYFVQLAFPLASHPRWGDRITGVLEFDQMFRRGPNLDLFTNITADGTFYPSLVAINPANGRATTHMEKYTAAVNYEVTRNLFLKLEFSYWALGNATTFTPENLAQFDESPDSYQTALSAVLAF